ncbi:MAG: flotillin [Deltaproteobacteria bacterium]|nr:MAG: flotillin [Deltaproteobacteria bacterium]
MLTVIVVLILVLGFVFGAFAIKFYVKTPPNMALIRTGLGGRKVVIDGGLIVLPVVHQIKWISLETVKLRVSRMNKEALITKDRFRVDVGAEFYMKVEPRVEDIETASRSLGDRSLNADSLKLLLEEKLVSALRAVAAEKTLVELHENRTQFAREIKEFLKNTLLYNGLTIEDVSIFHLDQTKKDQLDPNNIFDAEGLKQITAQTSQRLRERNEIERNTEVAIKQKDIEAIKLKLKLDQEREFASAEQIKEVENYKMLKRAEAEQFRFKQELSIKEAEINKDKLIREMEVEKERYLIQKMQEREKAEIDKDLALEVARIVRDIEVTRKERERIEEEKARLEAEAVKRRSVQLVITAEKKAEMERERELANINYIKELEIAELKAKAMERLAEAKFIEGEKEAQVIYKMREAENVLDTKFIVKDLVEEFIRSAPGIFRELMEPARSIESIRVLNINGAGFGGSGGDGGDTVSRVIGSIVSASAILPLVRETLKFSNLDGDELIKKVMEYIPSMKEVLKKESKEGIS